LLQDECRRHPRFACALPVRVKILRQGKPTPLEAGGRLCLQVTNISQTGAQLQTPWPLSLNDLLDVELPMPSQTAVLRRMARVVRVRQTGPGEWVAGIRFVGKSPDSKPDKT